MDTPRCLPQELTIYTASELRGQCLAWLADTAAGTPADADADDGWALEASSVDQVDAAGVQLLVSLARSLDAQSMALRLQGPSTPLVDACAALGLADWLSTRTAQGATA